MERDYSRGSRDRGTFAQHYAEQMSKDKKEPKTDLELRKREMDGDPMLEYFREQKRQKQGSEGSSSKVYKKPFPPNRYNIRPGYRWDGVDRSNGYEKKLIEREAQIKAREEESYRAATRDL